jgi:NAD(P)-dependent dehydrogenase (short-subunit alcohol dehydrogenase family)
LANILFTRELARRLDGTGVTANCLHPGFVATRFGADNGVFARLAIRIAMLGAIGVEKGADTIVYLASSPEVASLSGGYYQRRRLTQASVESQDLAAVQRLWMESALISGMAV